MSVMKHPLSALLLWSCLLGLSACDGTPDIPEGYTLLTPSESEVHAVPWNEDLTQPLRFAFEARAGRHYDFIVEAGTEGHVLELRDTAGTMLDYEIDESSSPSDVFSVYHWSGLTEDAVYTVDVSAFYSEARGPFSFRFVDKGADDHADLYATAAPWVPSEKPLTGRSEHYKERDLHSFQTVAGNVYALACTFPTTWWQLSITNRRGQLQVFAEGGPLSEEVTQGSTAFKSPGGVFYTDVQDLGDSHAPYSCVLRDRGAEDHGDTVETATALPAGTTSVQAKIEVVLDKDVFALGVVPGHHYRVSCTIDGKKMCEVASAAPGGEFSTSTSDRTWTTFTASEATHHVRVAINTSLPALWEEGHYTLQFEALDP